MSTATLTSTAPRRRGLAAVRAVVNRMTLPVLLLLPAIVIIVGLVGYPLARTVYLSFTDTDLGGLIYGGNEFVGLENFKEVFVDDRLRVSLINTVLLGTACVVGTMVLGFATALLLNQKLRGGSCSASPCCCRGPSRHSPPPRSGSGCSTAATASSTGCS